MRKQRSHHFQPCRDLQQPRGEDAPAAGIRVQTAVDETRGKSRGDLYAVKAMPPNCPRPSFKTQLRAAAIGTAPAPIPIAKLRGEIQKRKRYSIDCVLRTPPAALRPIPNAAQEQ